MHIYSLVLFANLTMNGISEIILLCIAEQQRNLQFILLKIHHVLQSRCRTELV